MYVGNIYFKINRIPIKIYKQITDNRLININKYLIPQYKYYSNTIFFYYDNFISKFDLAILCVLVIMKMRPIFYT
jgi:hypothetical protein